MSLKITLFLLFLSLSISTKVNQDKFGRHLLKLFFLDPEYRNINHGSYGSPPRSVVEKMRLYQEQMDFNPEKWIRYTIYEKLQETKEIIGKYIHADTNSLALVENASDGMNAILKTFLTSSEDKILIFDFAYGMVIGTLKYLHDKYNIQVVTCVIDESIINSDDLILSRIEDTILKVGKIKIASIDHIASVPALILPVKRIVELLHKYNIIAVIDGAHAVGQIPLDIEDINPDMYVSNFHKWFYVPKTASFLYVKKEFQAKLHPNINTVFYGTGFSQEFNYTGTRDYSAYFTVKDALEFRDQFGDKEIMTYMHDLALMAGNEVARIFETELLVTDPDKIGSLINVRIPCDDGDLLDRAVKKALYEYNTFVVTFKFSNGKYYTRLSAQIYNDITDYQYAASIFLKIVNEMKGERTIQ